MAGPKKKKTRDSSDLLDSSSNPETLERKRLKTLALSNNFISQTQAKPHSPLAPSKLLSKHHGRDIVKKSHRRNKFLFSFPGLLAPISGGKFGELRDLGSKNPILYVDFPQGRMKLFGTIVYPKNRYLTLQFPRGGKNVMCEDYFDNLIVFSDAWWIGSQDENPEESQLDFPEELSVGEKTEYDFKGGAGGMAFKETGHKMEFATAGEQSPTPLLRDDLSEDESVDLVKVTPVRQSARTAGKKFRFAEASPNEDSIASDADASEEDEKIIAKKEDVSVVFDIDDEDTTPNQGGTATSATQSKKQSSVSIKMKKSVEDSSSNRGPLIQTTISTLFKRVEEKKTSRNPKKVSSPKGGNSKIKKKMHESEDDDIEEFSSASQGSDESDEDWEA